MASDFTIVITTRNRPRLLVRAVRSVWGTYAVNPKIIVVDDCSEIDPTTMLREIDSEILLIRNPIRQGPGTSRNIGIRRALTRFVVILDDDDMMTSGALTEIDVRLMSLSDAGAYPCFQFARSNGRLDRSFGIITLADFVTQKISGDYTPVIQRQVFIGRGFRYPETLVGGENLLWFEIAKQHGIPTWNIVVTQLGAEAPTRLCSVDNQLLAPGEYASVQEQLLEKFGPDILSISKAYYMQRRLGAATYWLLAGNRSAARRHIQSAYRLKATPGVAAVWAASWLPGALLRRLFRFYRGVTI